MAAIGRRLRTRRTAAGRTIASVAVEAGLSVPYIANLENGRGNPTLAALTSVAQALGAHLRVDMGEAATPGGDLTLPDTLMAFARLPRFRAEGERVAEATGQHPPLARERMLAAMAAVAATTPRALDELDWHRILDVIVLIARA